MGLFDEKDHIKKSKEVDKYLKGVGRLSPKERKGLEKMLKPSILSSSGLSKNEFKKVLDKADKEGKIDHDDAYHIKKYGK